MQTLMKNYTHNHKKYIHKSEMTALFANPVSAEVCLNKLMLSGIPRTDISMLTSDSIGDETFKVTSKSKLTRGIGVGFLLGGVTSIIVMLVLLARYENLPEDSSSIMFGLGMYLLASFSFGATIGGIIGGLIGLSFTEHEAFITSNKSKIDSVLMSIRINPDFKSNVKTILQKNGAKSIH